MKNKEYGTLKKPLKVYEFVDIIIDLMKQNELIPDGIDYIQGHTWGDGSRELTDYEFDILTSTKWGTNEGIYTDFSIIGCFDEKSTELAETIYIGCAKSLNTSREEFYKMAKLGADFYLTATDYINQNLDDFSWRGYNLKFKEARFSSECSSEEGVIKNIKRYIEDGRDIYNLIITDLTNREIIPVNKYLKKAEIKYIHDEIEYDFDSIRFEKCMDSSYSEYPVMILNAVINGKKGKIYIGEHIRITDGNTSFNADDKDYHTIYGEAINEITDRRIIHDVSIHLNSNKRQIFTMINEGGF